MKRLPHFLTGLLICSSAIAGGGDLNYMGFSKDKNYSFSISFLDPLVFQTPSHASPVTIFPSKTHFISTEAHPESITGCLMVITEKEPAALVCGENTSNATFRRAIYVFSGKYLQKGSSFRCIHRCSKAIPRQFNVWEFL
jgi:hypothetical protein